MRPRKAAMTTRRRRRTRTGTRTQAEDAAARNHTSRKKMSMDLPEAPKEASKTISAKGPQSKQGPASSSESAKSKGAVAFSAGAGRVASCSWTLAWTTKPVPQEEQGQRRSGFDSPEVAHCN